MNDSISNAVLMWLIAFCVEIIGALWYMCSHMPVNALSTLNAQPAPCQPNRHHSSTAALIAKHEEALCRYEQWLQDNNEWADRDSERAQHLLLQALGPLEAYCYEMRRQGDFDEYYEDRLSHLIGILNADADFSAMGRDETDD